VDAALDAVVSAGLRIRVVESADLEALVALWHEVFPEYRDPTKPQRDPRANIERKLAQRDGLFWLAEGGEGIVGTAMAGYDGHRGWLYSVGVHPRVRRSGLARALVAHAEAALAKRGCPKINLQVMTANESAQAFWRAVGYAPDLVVSFGKRMK
jgi:ribosomal protein S18 acetylase RimI-like enzyme